MTKMRLVVVLLLVGLACGAQLAVAGQIGRTQPAERAPGYVAPFNLVVIVLDTSRSFQIPSQAPGVEGKVLAVEALGVVQRFFEAGAAQKRQRGKGPDQYYLVAADAASQTIWSGTRTQLGELTPAVLASKLAVRKQFAGCTDLKGALNEAASLLNRHPGAADSYVLVFSDLVHEPPRSGWASCDAPTGDPPPGIDWDTLRTAGLGFYYVSKDFRYRPDVKWRALLEGQGMTADFLDAAQTLTDHLALKPPAAAVFKPSQEQVEKATERVGTIGAGLWVAVQWIAVFLGVVVVGLPIGVVVARRRTLHTRRAA